jgi:hypothetical protein
VIQQAIWSNLDRTDSSKRYPRQHKKGCANGAAHTPEQYGVFEFAIAVSDDLAPNWRAGQCCKCRNRESGARADADILDGRDVCAKDRGETNASTGGNTEKRGKGNDGSLACRRQQQPENEDGRQGAHRDHHVEVADLVG